MIGRARPLLLALATVAVLGAAPQDRALALAVASFEDVWQTINDTFYDPKFGGVDWAGVRRELLPRVKAARTVEDVRVVIREMIDRLGHSHFELLSDSNALPGAGSIPIEIRVLASEVVITRVRGEAPAASGLKAGQVLLAVDGATAEQWKKARIGRDARAQNRRQWDAAYRSLYGEDDSMAVVKVRDTDGRQKTINVRRDAGMSDLLSLGNVTFRNARLNTTRLSTRSGRDVGVIAFTMWMGAISEPFAVAVDTFRGADGMIIDLRGNPGGLMGMIRRFSGEFMDDAVPLGEMRSRSAPVPLKFDANPQRATSDGRRVTPFAGPLAILVDDQTASTSEIFAGAMQSAGRARVFGRQTMGQALPASTKTLPNGDVLLHVVGDFVTPDGRSLEGPGVVPDEIVPLSIATLASGRDADLDAALSWIDRARSLLLCSGDLQGTQFLPRWVAPLMRP